MDFEYYKNVTHYDVYKNTHQILNTLEYIKDFIYANFRKYRDRTINEAVFGVGLERAIKRAIAIHIHGVNPDHSDKWIDGEGVKDDMFRVHHLEKITKKQLLSTPNLGFQRFKEIEKFMKSEGIEIKKEAKQ